MVSAMSLGLIQKRKEDRKLYMPPIFSGQREKYHVKVTGKNNQRDRKKPRECVDIEIERGERQEE